jgi:hypothetical protein
MSLVEIFEQTCDGTKGFRGVVGGGVKDGGEGTRKNLWQDGGDASRLDTAGCSVCRPPAVQ